MKKIILQKRTVANLSSAQMSEVQGASYAETDCMGSFGCTDICVSNNGCPTQNGCTIQPMTDPCFTGRICDGPANTLDECTTACPINTDECITSAKC